jgi:hypothetical protein
MTNEEILAMNVVEYVDFLIAMAEFQGHNDPHKTNWDYTYWHEVVSETRYNEATLGLDLRGIHSWQFNY